MYYCVILISISSAFYLKYCKKKKSIHVLLYNISMQSMCKCIKDIPSLYFMNTIFKIKKDILS